MNDNRAKLIVFSDLDGSLLDHFTYSFAAARPVIDALAAEDIPLVLASSKTCAELEETRHALDNTHPFIVENGAAVFIPQGYFAQPPGDAVARGGYLVYETVPGREQWLAVLERLALQFPGQFESFHSAGIAGVMAMTGLAEHQATAASDRAYSEPVHWTGTLDERERFLHLLRGEGATVMQGGRFISVSGDCNKGRALEWLREQYRRAFSPEPVEDLAIGDSENDRAMLEAAKTALLIRSPAHDFPSLTKSGGIMRSNETGPAGWSEGVTLWLRANRISL